MRELKRRIAAFCFVAPLGLAALPVWAAGLDVERTMDEATARSMLARFGYGPDQGSLATATRETPCQYLMRAIAGKSGLPPQIAARIGALPIAEPLERIWSDYGAGGTYRQDKANTEARKTLQKSERRYLAAAVQARMLAMANSDNQGHEVLLSFWLNHFSIFGQKSFDKLLAADYTKALERAMADDSFESLLRASFYHPAMQVYLDNAQSTAPDSVMARMAERRGKSLGLNENLAREVMELHTLGLEAGYTQQDVLAFARIITGAGVYSPRMNPQALYRAGASQIGLFLFDPRRHDYRSKTFLGRQFPAGHGLDEIDQALHILATSPATARHIAFKLAQRFLSDAPPGEVVDAMAREYERSGGRISATLLPLLASAEFAASLSSPAKFKEPLDYIVSAARIVCSGQPIGNGQLLAAVARDMDEAPYLHTTPDGYGMRESDWLSPPAMAKRTRYAMGLATGRLPLAGASEDKGEANDDAEQGKRWATGAACAPDMATVANLVGPLSPATRAAAQNLVNDPQRIAFYLASPEFLRR